jgi:hypothetical protein
VRRGLATTLAAGLLVVACSGAGDADPAATLEATPEPSPTATESAEPDEEPEDPYAIPDEIDDAYVERVINAILEVQSEVLRGSLQQEQGTSLAADLMALHFATTDGRQRVLGLEEYQGYIDDPDTRGGLREDIPPTSRGRFTVDYVHHSEPERCVLALGYWDRTELSENAPTREETLTAISLSRVDPSAVSSGNPTPWQWRHNLGVDGATAAEEWAALPWGESIDHSCEDLASVEGAS